MADEPLVPDTTVSASDVQEMAPGLTLKQAQEVAEEIKILDSAPCVDYLSTGCTVLDLAIANRLPGGFGVGRISHIYGERSGGKSVFLQEVMGSAQRHGGKAYCDDAEMTMDFTRATSLFGVETKDPVKWDYNVPETIEDLFDDRLASILKERRTNSRPGAWGIDSLSVLSCKGEVEQKLDKDSYNTHRSKMISQAFRKYFNPLMQKNLTAVFVDQVRDNVGQMFGPQYTVSGGKALSFYSSTQVLFTVKKSITNEKGIPVGVELAFKVEKNKIAPPFRSGMVMIYFDYGIDDISTSLMWLKKYDDQEYAGISEEKKKTLVFFGGHKETTLEDMAQFIESSKLQDALRQQVEAVWRRVYTIKQRAPKLRWN